MTALLEARAPIESNPTFPLLDSMRAVGALAVLTTHVAFQAGSYTEHGSVGALLSRLDIGVAIFFVLSGFLLSRSFLARAALGRPAPAARHYLWKRFLRITPVYLLTAVAALLLVRENRGTGFGDWVATLLLGNTYVSTALPYGLTQMWSLAVEVAFYLCLPVLMYAAVGRRRRLSGPRVGVVLVAMTALSVLWHLVWADDVAGATDGSPLQWLPAYLTWFAVGIGLAVVSVRHQHGSSHRVVGWVVAAGRQPGSCWATATGLMLLASTSVAGPTLLIPPTPAQSLTKHLLYGAVGALVVLPGVFAPPSGRFARVLGHPVARHLGLISYSVFCVHVAILSLVMWLTGWELFGGHLLGIWVLTAGISLVLAEALYRFVELPTMRLRNLGRPVPASTSMLTSGTSIR